MALIGKCECDHHRGVQKNYLQAHHKAEKSQYPEYADDPDNLLNCCYDCHKYKIHDNGNFRDLSAYGEGLKIAYLRKKGAVKEDIKRETTNSIEKANYSQEPTTYYSKETEPRDVSNMGIIVGVVFFVALIIITFVGLYFFSHFTFIAAVVSAILIPTALLIGLFGGKGSKKRNFKFPPPPQPPKMPEFRPLKIPEFRVPKPPKMPRF